MFAGAENSIHAKDPNNKNAPGTLTQFMTTIANNYPVQYLQVLSKFIPQQINSHRTEPSPFSPTNLSSTQITR